MLSSAQEFMLIDPMQAVYPGLCILLVVLAVNFIGDGIRDALDPRQQVTKSRRRLEQWRKKTTRNPETNRRLCDREGTAQSNRWHLPHGE
ncbi:hypothetical protein ACFTAO_02825 [Paenibacillus rhizoplanae]